MSIFGYLYDKRIRGLMVLRPAQYFERRAQASPRPVFKKEQGRGQ